MSVKMSSPQKSDALRKRLYAAKTDLVAQVSWLEKLQADFEIQLEMQQLISLSEEGLRHHPLLSHVPDENIRELCLAVTRVHLLEATIASCEKALGIDADLLRVLLAGNWRQLDQKTLLRAVRAAIFFFNINQEELVRLFSKQKDLLQILNLQKKDVFLAERLLEGVRDGRNVLELSSSFGMKPEESIKRIGLAVVLEEARRIRRW